MTNYDKLCFLLTTRLCELLETNAPFDILDEYVATQLESGSTSHPAQMEEEWLNLVATAYEDELLFQLIETRSDLYDAMYAYGFDQTLIA